MKTIGKYEVCGLLGKGGMGTVYKVRLPVVGKIVALKQLSPHPVLVGLLGKEEIRRRFVNEALTMAALRHPHIVAIWDFHDHDDLTYFVMEYFCNNLGSILGESYRVERPSRVIRVDKALAYTRQILLGLHRLHQAGIVHRDIKPYNILVTDDDRVKITDFGLSKLRGETFKGPGNLMVGSAYYAAPEQERNPDHVDARADLYPVGVMLYRMLTGALPIDTVERVARSNPDLDDAWDDFLHRAMATEPEARFSDARAMLAALDELEAAWEEKKERTCRMPVPQTPSSGLHAVSAPLRTTPIKVRSGRAREAFNLDERWRPARFVPNTFEVNPDGTVADRATGLLWEQAGSEFPVTWTEAHQYVAELNRDRFAGRSDWRLPTVDELNTLLTDVPRAADLCIAPVFDGEKRWLWSCDRRSFVAAWIVSVDMGYVSWQDCTCYYYVRAVSLNP